MKTLFALPILFCLASCTPKATPVGSTPDSNTDCRLVMCTMEYRTLSIKVVDAAGKPVKLDSYKTVLSGKGTTVTEVDNNANPQEGIYPVISDNWTRDHRNTTTKMIFVGMLGNKPVVTETFDIKTDCCHISRLSGRETVTIR